MWVAENLDAYSAKRDRFMAAACLLSRAAAGHGRASVSWTLAFLIQFRYPQITANGCFTGNIAEQDRRSLRTFHGKHCRLLLNRGTHKAAGFLESAAGLVDRHLAQNHHQGRFYMSVGDFEHGCRLLVVHARYHHDDPL